MALRVLAFFILLFSVLFMPFWVSLVLGAGLMLYFPLYFEAIFLFLLSDLLFGVEASRFFNITYATFIVGIILFIVIQFVKKETRFYRKEL